MLERRRAELGYGFRQRHTFVRDRGAGAISVKTISRLEKGERDSYPESTIGTVELMYQWSPGSVESVLAGGQPSALVTAPPPDRNPITVADTPPTPGERLASWVYVRMRERGSDDEDIYNFLDSEDLPREPTSVSSVKRIAEVTGATFYEVLALLGVEDFSARRSQWRATARGDHDAAMAGNSDLGDAGLGAPAWAASASARGRPQTLRHRTCSSRRPHSRAGTPVARQSTRRARSCRSDHSGWLSSQAGQRRWPAAG
jgi:hypothetical protein